MYNLTLSGFTVFFLSLLSPIEIQKDNETSLKGKVTTTGIDDANLTKTVTVYDVCDSSFREPNRAARTHKVTTYYYCTQFLFSFGCIFKLVY